MTTSMNKTEPAVMAGAKTGKYLSLYLGAEEFAIPVSSVREIMGIQDITPIPQTPTYVRGVINLRGRVIPVIDMRRKCGLSDIAYGPHACIIVVQVQTGSSEAPMGVVVDGVSEVVNICSNDVEEMPDFGTEKKAYLLGVAKLKGSVKILLDINQLLNNSEILALEGAGVQ